jgi:hypothetical protein
MTPESLPDLPRITEHLELHFDLVDALPAPARILSLERELPSNEELEAWLAEPLGRAA